MAEWERVRLGEVLDLKVDAVTVDPGATYNISGVYSFGRGLINRGPLSGSDTSTVDPGATYNISGVYSFGRGLINRGPLSGSDTSYKVFHQLHEDDLVVSQLKAWEGALARVTAEFDGWFLSPQFPTFRVKADRLDIGYLELFCQQSSVWEALRNQAQGMGARRDSVSPTRFLSIEIPLPPLPEQRRIVARVKGLLEKVEEAQVIGETLTSLSEQFVVALHLSMSSNRAIRVGDFLMLDEHKVLIESGNKYPQVGIRSFGKGLFEREVLDNTQTSYKQFHKLYSGAIVLSQVKGWEGALGVCPKVLVGRYASPEFRTFRCVESEASPDYLAALIRTEWFWSKLKDATRGVGARRERTRPEQVLNIELPMPALSDQQRAIHFLEKLHSVTEQRKAYLPELDALPASILARAFAGAL